ncbi:MAG: helix-turn-helix transcriptional regulator [Kiritimatiellae bacterium]|nr:helix-turn-helix transcriptional regulator [Kiritimatiellia bacterium]
MTLKEARERVGKTQSEMAELLGISRNYLALIEVGKRPESTDLLEKALLIVNKSSKELTTDEWKARAIAAESKVEKLKKSLAALLDAL